MRAFMFAIAVLTAGPSHAACTQPESPACALRTGPFAGARDFDECRKLMLTYRDDIEAYAVCVKPQSAADEKAARDAYHAAWSQFNRRARETPETPE